MERFIEEFRKLGLTRHETLAYFALLRGGPNTAPGAAKVAKLSTSKIYDIMVSLVGKGFAVEEPGKPRKFRALDAAGAAEAIIKRKESELRSAKDSIMERIAKVKKDTENKGIWVIRGRHAIEEAMADMISNAENRVILQRANGVLAISHLLEKAKLRGVDVEENGSWVTSNMLNVDGKEMLIYTSSSEAVWIKDKKYCGTEAIGFGMFADVGAKPVCLA